MRAPLILSTLLVGAALAATADVHAAPPNPPAPAPATIDVDVVETSGKTSRTFTVALTMASERDCSSASVDLGAASYAIEVCRSEAATGVMSFVVTRSTRGKDPDTRKFRVSSRLTVGQRAVVGRMAQGDEVTEVAATVR